MSEETGKYLENQKDIAKHILFCQDKEELRKIGQGLLTANRNMVNQHLDLNEEYIKLAKLAKTQATLIEELRAT